MSETKSVLIVGGGLSGLISANYLAACGIKTIVIEKKSYPFHRVCGEYISNETIPFLRKLDLFPEKFEPASIKNFQLTSVHGKSASMKLDLGGFGISRYTFDNFLYQKAKERGVEFFLNTEVDRIEFNENRFIAYNATQSWQADVVLGAFGKRSKLDATLNRNFMKMRSPYIGVKYHIKTDYPSDLISLHNFKDGYCGISQIEDEKFNVCYLSHRNNLKERKNIQAMEEEVLFRNPFLKDLFMNSDFLFPRPEVINEISFATKTPVDNHILMMGDAAGMITPLCGNGMALAIHSAKVASELVYQFATGKIMREQLERMYQKQWRNLFSTRLWIGRQVQLLFGAEWTSNLAVNLMRTSKPVSNLIMKSTHGNPF